MVDKLTPLDPEYHCRSGTEHGEQTALFCWINNEFKARTEASALLNMAFAIPNGGERTASVGASLKAEGVKKGVPDVCLPVPMMIGTSSFVQYNGLYIEMKRATGTWSDVKPEQTAYLNFLAKQGYAVAVCFGWQQAKQCLIDYISGKKIPWPLRSTT